MALRIPKFVRDLLDFPAPSPGKFLRWSGAGSLENADSAGGGSVSPASIGIFVGPTQPALVSYAEWAATRIGYWGWVQTQPDGVLVVALPTASMPMSVNIPVITVVGAGPVIAVPTASLVMAANVPNVSIVSAGIFTIAVPSASLVLTAYAPGVSIISGSILSIAPPQASLALTARVPAISIVSAASSPVQQGAWVGSMGTSSASCTIGSGTAGRLLVACLAAGQNDQEFGPNRNFSISGWTRATQDNAQFGGSPLGDVEVWYKTGDDGTSKTVTATETTGDAAGTFLAVISFTGASGVFNAAHGNSTSMPLSQACSANPQVGSLVYGIAQACSSGGSAGTGTAAVTMTSGANPFGSSGVVGGLLLKSTATYTGANNPAIAASMTLGYGRIAVFEVRA